MSAATAIKIAHTSDMSREAWLKARRQGIGSSDAAAIAGLNPWSSAMAVWLDKTGRTPLDDGGSEAAYFGTLLEPLVADEFARRTEKRIRRCNYILQHPEHPFMLANIDRELVGEKALLECKTTSAYNADKWDGEQAPLEYVIQVQHQLAVTGYDHAHFAVLIGGQQFRHYEIERDDDLIRNLIKLEADFWRYVTEDTMPPADGSDSAREAIASLHPSPVDEEIDLAPDAAALFRQYDAAANAEKTAKREKQEAANRLAQLLGDYRKGGYVIGDKRRTVQWTSRIGSVDWAQVCEDYEIADVDDYRKAPTRSLRVS